MNILNGLTNFLTLVNDNWTVIMVIIGLIIGILQKIKSYIKLGNDKKIEIAKEQISEIVLKLISDAEADYAEWSSAGSIKRSQVIEKIYSMYPVLSKFMNQPELVAWIDSEIDNSLNILRDVIKKNTIDTVDNNTESK